ncbi:hypothetical protein ACOSQ4_028792 [Xanthoceras sorbifolium]
MLCEEALNSNCGIQSKLSADLEGVWVTMHGNLACMRNVKNSASNLVKLGQWAVSGLQTISFDANTVIGLKGKRVVEGPSILSKALLENISGGGQIHASGSKWKRRARYRILTNKGRGSKELLMCDVSPIYFFIYISWLYLFYTSKDDCYNLKVQAVVVHFLHVSVRYNKAYKITKTFIGKLKVLLEIGNVVQCYGDCRKQK